MSDLALNHRDLQSGYTYVIIQLIDVIRAVKPRECARWARTSDTRAWSKTSQSCAHFVGRTPDAGGGRLAAGFVSVVWGGGDSGIVGRRVVDGLGTGR